MNRPLDCLPWHYSNQFQYDEMLQKQTRKRYGFSFGSCSAIAVIAKVHSHTFLLYTQKQLCKMVNVCFIKYIC